MKNVIITIVFAFISSAVLACVTAPRFHAPEPGMQAYAERSVCVHTDVPRKGPQYTCGNERYMTSVSILAPGHARVYFSLLAREGVSPFLTFETTCYAFEPTTDEQCGFEPGAPVGSSATLRSGVSNHVINMTLVANGYALYEVKGSCVGEMDFTEILATPLTREDRHFLIKKGVPAGIVFGIF